MSTCSLFFLLAHYQEIDCLLLYMKYLAFILLFLFDVLVIQASYYPTIFQVQFKTNDCTTGVICWSINTFAGFSCQILPSIYPQRHRWYLYRLFWRETDGYEGKASPSQPSKSVRRLSSQGCGHQIWPSMLPSQVPSTIVILVLFFPSDYFVFVFLLISLSAFSRYNLYITIWEFQ